MMNFCFPTSAGLVGRGSPCGPRGARAARRGKPNVAGQVSGFTLPELLLAVTVTSFLSLVLGGLITAMQTAWDHTRHLEAVESQARASLERIRYMVSQAGLYQTGSQPVRPGIAVVSRTVGGTTVPCVLVVWSGGRHGGMAANGVQTRLPRINELVIYTPDPAAPTRLVEIVAPNVTTSIDFNASTFDSTILTLLGGKQVQLAPLCDRLRTSLLASGTSGTVGNIRFEIFERPTASEIAAVSPGTVAWKSLVWAGGVCSSDSGLRQLTLRTEMLLETRTTAPAATSPSATALPFFGSASYRYVYQP